MNSKQRNYWNRVAPTKSFTTAVDLQLLDKFIAKDAHILDYGCGYGRTLNELHIHGYTNLTGFDYAEEMIRRGKREFPHLDLRVSVDDSIDFPTESVDMVLLFAVLTCIIDDEAQQHLIREIKRILKPNGLIYINDFLINDDDRNRKRYKEFSSQYTNYGVFALQEGAALRHHTEAHIFNLMKDFYNDFYKKTSFRTMNGHISNGFVYIGRKI